MKEHNIDDVKDSILWDILFHHWGHHVEISFYGDANDPDDICLECMDCNEVLVDAGIYTICAREDGFM